MSDLDTRLLAAHARGDTTALVALYREAAHGVTDPNARCFYLTHAHVFALELGHPDVPILRKELIELGCESPL